MGRLEPLYKSPHSLSQQEDVLGSIHVMKEPVPAPVLPPASTAQSTHLSYVTQDLSIALFPYMALPSGGSAEQRGPCTNECLLRSHVPSLGWELLSRNCCCTTSQGTTPELQTLSQRQSRLFPFKACSQNLISQHDQVLC